MPTLNRRIERLESIYPSLNQEITFLLRELCALTNESEAGIISRFLEEQAEEQTA